MKLTYKLLLFVAMFAAILLPRAARADDVTIAFNNAVQSVTPAGGTLIFSGTVKNTSSVTEYFSADPLSFSLDQAKYVMDDTNGFYSNLFSLDPGAVYTGELFRLTLASGLSAGSSYIGTYTLLGGPSDDYSDQFRLGTANIQTNIVAAAVASTPEPSSLLLLGTGLLGGVGVLRRRFRN